MLFRTHLGWAAPGDDPDDPAQRNYVADGKWDVQSVYSHTPCADIVNKQGYPHILDLSDKGGAKVMTRLVDGVDTGQSLWPWPMNARLLAATSAHSDKPVDVTREVFGLCGGSVPSSF